MKSEVIKDLRKVTALSDLAEEHLGWLADRVEYREFEDGTTLTKKGEIIDVMYFIIEGKHDFYMDVNGLQVFYYSFGNDSFTGGVSGLLPYSRMKESPGYAYSIGKTIAYSLDKKYFQELEQLNPALIQRLIGYMTERARVFATTQLQYEKVNALGKLAAGIAHEMNNPASAINRISAELSRRLNENYILTEKLLEHKISSEQIRGIRLTVEEKNQTSKKKLSPLEKMEKEDEITGWLEQNSPGGNSIALEAFVESGFTREDLGKIKEVVSKESCNDVLKWIENLLISQRIIKDLDEASNRISGLVGAIKSHVHMDRTNALQPTDINRDIENTITLMSYKLKEKNIKIKKLFGENLSGVPAYIGELNQVWTNLIDNAIYAIDKDGELTVETSNDGNFAEVKIIDSGCGIPPEIQSRIFDPFFTTKKVGEGTGIGLDLVNRIIKHHDGDIKVNSKPGRTEFVIRIPAVNRK